jgi:predicted phage tail protein
MVEQELDSKALAEEVKALRREVETLRNLIVEHEIQIEKLKRRYRTTVVTAEQSHLLQAQLLNEPTPIPVPALNKPIEYWAEHIPDFGEEYTEQQIAERTTKPRVRASDIKLSSAEREQLAKPTRPAVSVAPDYTPEVSEPNNGCIFLVLGGIAITVIIFLGLWMAGSVGP